MKDEFPILKNITYLDNAATTQKPTRVIEKIKKYYEESNANPHRGIYELSVKSTNTLNESRRTIANFINADENEIFFLKNATEGFNYLAQSLKKQIKQQNNKKIITTILEHHSNYLPWQNLAKELGMKFEVIKDTNIEQGIIDKVNNDTQIVTFTHMSNVTGKILNAEKIIKKIREKNKECTIIIDAAQSIAHKDINVKEIDCDFLVFSSHKIYGPLGVGVVYGKKELLQKLEPAQLGGGMIENYKNEKFTYNENPLKFEAGTIDVASISGLAEAIKFFKEKTEKFKTEQETKNYALSELKKIKDIKIIGHEDEEYGPVISFTIKNIHPHDFASIANSNNVCVRAGHHCAKPYLEFLGLNATTRISLGIYNTKEDVDKLIESIKKAKVIFNG